MKKTLFLFLIFAGVLAAFSYCLAVCPSPGQCVPQERCSGSSTIDTRPESACANTSEVCCMPPVKCDSASFQEIGGVCFPKNTGLAETPIATILSNALFWLLGIFGFFGIAGFVISGIQYLTSAGDEKGIETAKRNMKWSLVGVIVALSGYVIVLAVDAALRARPYF